MTRWVRAKRRPGFDPVDNRCASCREPLDYGRRLCPACLPPSREVTIGSPAEGCRCDNCGRPLRWGSLVHAATGTHYCGHCLPLSTVPSS